MMPENSFAALGGTSVLPTMLTQDIILLAAVLLGCEYASAFGTNVNNKLFRNNTMSSLFFVDHIIHVNYVVILDSRRGKLSRKRKP